MSVPVYNHFEEVFTLQTPMVGVKPTITEQISNTGEVRQVVITVPAFTGDSITCTVEVLDENGALLFTSGTLNPGTTTKFYPFSANMPFCVSSGADHQCIIQAQLSAAPTHSGGGQVLANFFIKA